MIMQSVWEKRFRQVVQAYVVKGVDTFGERVALSHFEKLKVKLTTLEKYPELGFPEPLLAGKKREYRTLVFEKRYKIIYSIDYQKEIVYLHDFWDL